MQPAPAGIWGMPPDILQTLPGYNPDVAKNRAEARQIMQKLGYGPDKRLKIKVSTRDLPFYRDPAVILIDQLKEVYIDGELEMIDTTALVSQESCARTTSSVSTLRRAGPIPTRTLECFTDAGRAEL